MKKRNQNSVTTQNSRLLILSMLSNLKPMLPLISLGFIEGIRAMPNGWRYINGTACSDLQFQTIFEQGPENGYIQLMSSGIRQGCTIFLQNNETGAIIRLAYYSGINIPLSSILNWTGVYATGAALSGLDGITASAYLTIFYSLTVAGTISASMLNNMTQFIRMQTVKPLTFWLNETSVVRLGYSIFSAPVSFMVNGSSQIISYGNTFLANVGLFGTSDRPLLTVNSVADIVYGLLMDSIQMLFTGQPRAGEAMTAVRNIQATDGVVNRLSKLYNLMLTIVDNATRCTDDAKLAAQFANATTANTFYTEQLPAEKALCGSGAQNVPGWFSNWLQEFVPSPSPSFSPTPMPSLAPMPSPSPMPSWIPIPSPTLTPSSNPLPSPAPTPYGNGESVWWPYLMPLVPLCAFVVERITAIHVFNNQLERAKRNNQTTLYAFWEHCLQYVQDESVYNVLVGAMTGIVCTTNREMNGRGYKIDGSIFITIAVFFSTEITLNLLMGCYDAHVQKRPLNPKALARSTIIRILIGCITLPLSLYALSFIDNFLLLSLGAQGIRQCMALSVQGIKFCMKKIEVVKQNNEDSDLLINNTTAISSGVESERELIITYSGESSPSNPGDNIEPIISVPEITTSVSVAFKAIKALLAVGTTVSAIAAILWIMNKPENHPHTPAEDIALNAALGALIGALSTMVFTVMAVGTGMAVNNCSQKENWGSVTNFFSCCKDSKYEELLDRTHLIATDTDDEDFGEESITFTCTDSPN